MGVRSYTLHAVKLTVTVITRNESSNIAASLESVAWADEIIVVDSHSTDDTVAIARRMASRVELRDWPGYGAQKNYAATIASNDWILSIDADERYARSPQRQRDATRSATKLEDGTAAVKRNVSPEGHVALAECARILPVVERRVVVPPLMPFTDLGT